MIEQSLKLDISYLIRTLDQFYRLMVSNLVSSQEKQMLLSSIDFYFDRNIQPTIKTIVDQATDKVLAKFSGFSKATINFHRRNHYAGEPFSPEMKLLAIIIQLKVIADKLENFGFNVMSCHIYDFQI